MRNAYLRNDVSLSQGTHQGSLNCLGTSQSMHDKWLEIRLECVSGVRHEGEAGVLSLLHLKESLTGIFRSWKNTLDGLI